MYLYLPDIQLTTAVLTLNKTKYYTLINNIVSTYTDTYLHINIKSVNRKHHEHYTLIL